MIHCTSYENLKKVCYRLRSKGFVNLTVKKIKNTQQEYFVDKGKSILEKT